MLVSCTGNSFSPVPFMGRLRAYRFQSFTSLHSICVDAVSNHRIDIAYLYFMWQGMKLVFPFLEANQHKRPRMILVIVLIPYTSSLCDRTHE